MPAFGKKKKTLSWLEQPLSIFWELYGKKLQILVAAQIFAELPDGTKIKCIEMPRNG